MKKLRLSLLIIVLCLLGSKSQAIVVTNDGNTLTITLDMYEHLTEDVVKDYYETATKVIVKTNTTDAETLSNLTYLVPADFEILNKFKEATTMDLHSVNYLFSDISLKGESLKYVRLRDGIKNIQQAWFGSAIEGAYSYSQEGATNAYCVYCNSQSKTGGQIGDIFSNLNSQFSEIYDQDPHKLKLDNNHLYVLVNGHINFADIGVLKGTGLNYGAVDMSLLNATYVDNNGDKDYENFVLRDMGDKLKSIALPRNMDCIGNYCLEGSTAITKVIIPDGVTYIGDHAFDRCSSITSINIPENCTRIGVMAFQNTRLQAVKLPSTLTSIEEGAFTGNKDLTSITFPKPATKLTLGEYVFSQCNNLRDIYITADAPIIDTGSSTGSNRGTFTERQLGLDPNGENLQNNGSVTIDNYRKPEGENPIFLHYPRDKDHESEYGETPESSRSKTYSLTGAEKIKYPANNTEADDWYNSHKDKGWAQFVFASAFDEPSIDVPEQYNDDRWYTMCFPFNLTRKQIEDIFGSGTEVCDFQYVEKENIGEALVYSIRFNHDLIVNGVDAKGNPITPGSQIITKADKPYMIHPSQKPVNGKYYQITDGDRVEYEEKDGQTVEKGNLINFETKGHTAVPCNGAVSEATTSAPAHVKAVFQGNYEENRLIPYGVFFLGSEEYYKIEASDDQTRTKGYLNPYTAYVEIKDLDAETYITNLKKNRLPNQAKIIYPSQWGEDDMSSSTTTAILPVHVASKPVDMENVRIYNLQGQLVGIGADTLKTLHNGIYVMNGKKYVIR